MSILTHFQALHQRTCISHVFNYFYVLIIKGKAGPFLKCFYVFYHFITLLSRHLFSAYTYRVPVNQNESVVQRHRDGMAVILQWQIGKRSSDINSPEKSRSRW